MAASLLIGNPAGTVASLRSTLTLDVLTGAEAKRSVQGLGLKLSTKAKDLFQLSQGLGVDLSRRSRHQKEPRVALVWSEGYRRADHYLAGRGALD